MKIKYSLFSASCLLFIGALPASAATTLYTTDFETPTYSNGALLGQDSWVATGSPASIVNPIAVASGTVSLVTTGADIRRAFSAVTPATVDSVFLKASITVGAAQATGDYFLHLGDNSNTIFNARTYVKSSGAGFLMAVGTGAGTVTYGSTVLDFGTTYSILVRYNFVSGLANDTGALYINPTTVDGSGDTAYVGMTTVGTDAVTFSSVNLRQGGSGSAPTVTIDNISVSSIPEPASALLGSLGILGLLRRRRF